MTLSHKNNTRNGLPSQNHMKMMCYTCSWLHLLKNQRPLLDLEIPGGHFFALKKIPPKGAKVAPGLFLLGTSQCIRINHKHRPCRETRLKWSKSTGLKP